MTIKPDYVNYNKRILYGLLIVLLITFFYILLLFSVDFGKFGIIILATIYLIIFSILMPTIILRNKYYLNEIIINDNECFLEIFERDKLLKTINLNLQDTRIKIYESFFFATKFGRNFKLIIESKQGLTYKKVFVQHEIGNWDIDKFKDVLKLYGEMKNLKVSTASYTRTNFSTDKN